MQKTPLVITACIIVAAIAGLVILRWAGKGQEPEPEAAPPEIRQVIEHTRELLRLVANKDGAEIVRRFYKPDTERYGKTSELLWEIVRGSGAKGLAVFKANSRDDYEVGRKVVREYGTRNPDYVASVLAAICFADGALNRSFGPKVGQGRTDAFIGSFYMSLVFHNVDVGTATIAGAVREDDPEDRQIITVTVRYPENPATMPGVASPTSIPWRRLPDGQWTLDLGSAEQYLLEEVVDFLRRCQL